MEFSEFLKSVSKQCSTPLESLSNNEQELAQIFLHAAGHHTSPEPIAIIDGATLEWSKFAFEELAKLPPDEQKETLAALVERSGRADTSAR